MGQVRHAAADSAGGRACQTAAMPGSPTAELSALASSLDDLTQRIGTLAQSLDQEPTDRAAIDLYETERSLRTASRRLESAQRELRTT